MPSELRAETTAPRLRVRVAGPVPPRSRPQAGRRDAATLSSRRRPVAPETPARAPSYLGRGGAAGGPRALQPRRGHRITLTDWCPNTTYF